MDRWNSFVSPDKCHTYLMFTYTPSSNNDGSNSEHGLQSRYRLNPSMGPTRNRQSRRVIAIEVWLYFQLHSTDSVGFQGCFQFIFKGNIKVTKLISFLCFFVLKPPLKKKTKIGFQGPLWLNAGQKYCRILQESILQYFRPSFNYHLSLRLLFCLFLSGRIRQVFTVICIFFGVKSSFSFH